MYANVAQGKVIALGFLEKHGRVDSVGLFQYEIVAGLAAENLIRLEGGEHSWSAYWIGKPVRHHQTGEVVGYLANGKFVPKEIR